MLCPNCQTEAGAAEFCPKCLGQMPKPPPADAKPPEPAPASAPASAAPGAKPVDSRRQMIIYGGVVLLAISLGFSGAALYEHLAHPEPDKCPELCGYADVPGVWGNANFQAQLKEHGCNCPPPKPPPPHTPNGAPPAPKQDLPSFPEPEPPAPGATRSPPSSPAPAPTAPSGGGG
jgi:hypothetical protein